jgi:hypothetical protein
MGIFSIFNVMNWFLPSHISQIVFFFLLIVNTFPVNTVTCHSSKEDFIHFPHALQLHPSLPKCGGLPQRGDRAREQGGGGVRHPSHTHVCPALHTAPGTKAGEIIPSLEA